MTILPVLGTRVAATTRSEAADQVVEWARAGDRAYAVEAADVHVITRARHEQEFGAAIANFDLVCPDGMPLVWSLNRRLDPDRKLHERVSGAELMGEIFRRSREAPELRHFLLGGSEKLLATLTDELAEKFPGATVAGSYSPPFGAWPDDEFERICGKIRESNANLVWVGLGCPKQEHWIGDNKDRLPAGVYFGIGAAFAFHAGLVERAPGWCQKSGLEWAFRIYREPRRLFRRYFTYNSLFFYYSLREKLG